MEANNIGNCTEEQPGTPEPETPGAHDLLTQFKTGTWCQDQKILILMLIFVTPVGLYGLYRTELYAQKTRQIIAVIAVVLGIALFKPALVIWLVSCVGIGSYILYKVLPFEKPARIGIAAFVGLFALGAVGHMTEGNPPQEKKAESTRSAPKPTTTSKPAPPSQAVSEPRSKPQAAPVPAQPAPQPLPAPAQAVPAPPVSQAKAEAKPTSEPERISVSGISWAEVRGNFIETDLSLTSAQKDKLNRERKKLWNDSYKGKWVSWRGTVKNVASRGVQVKLDMGEGSLIMSDLRLNVAPGSREKAADLDRDATVTFVGKMSDQPNSAVPMDLYDVTIE